MSGSLEATPEAIRSFDPSLSGFIIVATWFVLQTSAYWQIWVHCQLQILAGAGKGLRERFRSLTRASQQNAPSNKLPAGHLTMADHR